MRNYKNIQLYKLIYYIRLLIKRNGILHIAQSYNNEFLSRQLFLEWMDVISSISMLWCGESDSLWRLEIHSTLIRATAWEKII